MNTEDSLCCSKQDLKVAVIGDFQIGKSTFVNCLTERMDAAIGKGVTTTHQSTAYLVSSGVSVIDTPGFNAPGDSGKKDEQEARDAINCSFAVIVYLNKSMGDVCRSLVKEALSRGKRCVFIYNCMDPNKWSPEESEDIRRSIEAEIENLGCADSAVRLRGTLVHSINAQWALYGLGLLDDERSARKIRNYAYDDLGLSQGTDLKCEFLKRSRILEIKQYIRNLPLEVLLDFLDNRDREIRRMTDRFCEEFSRRMAG